MSLGFIILRHVNSVDTNRYWKICYERIRKYYPESKIIIIDDNSDYTFVDMETQRGLYKTTVIRSIWAGCGELLPYFYFVCYGWFDTSVILHDSVFVNKHIDFESTGTRGYRFLWEFEVKQDQLYMEHHIDEVKLMQRFDSRKVNSMLEFHNCKEAWVGCFGAMAVVKYDYLKKVNRLFPLANLLDGVSSRFNRMSFERIIACLFQYTDKFVINSNELIINNNKQNISLHDEGISIFGNIFTYCKWGIGFDVAIAQNDLPMIKVWTGR